MESKWTDQLAEELHKPIKRKFTKRRVLSDGIYDIWSADLVYMQWSSKEINGVKYLVNVIDVFSKYAWSVPIRDKTGKSIVGAFQHIVDTSHRIPKKLWLDQGTEFYNRTFKKWLNDNNIDMYSTYNEGKAVIVERFNRTLKERKWKYFSAKNTYHYLDVIDQLVHHYNTTKHRSIKMTPTKASMKSNEIEVYNNLYGDLNPAKRRAKYKVGDKVRISKWKGTFEKGYTPRWTEEVFEIYMIQKTYPITYRIKDWNGDLIDGSFYEQELQKTSQTDVFRVEKILKTDKKNNMVFVKWKGYPNTFNSWIPKASTENL